MLSVVQHKTLIRKLEKKTWKDKDSDFVTILQHKYIYQRIHVWSVKTYMRNRPSQQLMTQELRNFSTFTFMVTCTITPNTLTNNLVLN